MEIIEIVKVEAPDETPPNTDYVSTITIKNNLHFPLIFRYIHTVNGRITTNLGIVRAKKTTTLSITTRAGDAGTEHHKLSVKALLIFQDTAEWDVTIKEIPAAKIIATEFRKGG